jgi:hypothetical protein
VFLALILFLQAQRLLVAAAVELAVMFLVLQVLQVVLVAVLVRAQQQTLQAVRVLLGKEMRVVQTVVVHQLTVVVAVAAQAQ